MDVMLGFDFIIMTIKNEHRSLTEMLAILDGKRIDEPDFELNLLEKYPKDFEFITSKAQHGRFFSEQPQLDLRGWSFQLTVKKEYTEIKISGIK